MKLGNFKYIDGSPLCFVRCDDLKHEYKGFICVINKWTKIVDVFNVTRTPDFSATSYVGTFIANELNFNDNISVCKNFESLREWFSWSYKVNLIVGYGDVWREDDREYKTFKPIVDVPNHITYSTYIVESIE